MNNKRDAQRELALRELARKRLIDFCQYVDPAVAHLYDAPHLRLMAEYIEQAIDGRLWANVPGKGKKILLITTPPGHWKSSLISRKLPAWYVGHQMLNERPHQMILTSYNAKLAQANNAKVLELMNTKLYGNVFPHVALSRSQQNSEEWSVENVPFTSCKAAGVGGGLTGYHANMAVVDDPIKDRKDANSKTVRETLWDWWKDVLRTRLLNEDSFILGVWTRWTEDDPAGRIMAAQAEGLSDEQVIMLRLPALAETEAERQSAAKSGLPVDEADPLGREPGQALWPEIETAEEHEATRRAYPVTFDSLYQGRPRPAGGYMVNEMMFKTLPALPERNVRWVWATDWAISEKETADYTVIGLVGLWEPIGQEGARLVIGYMERGRHNPHEARQMVKRVMLDHAKRLPMYSGQANMDTAHLFQMRRDAEMLRYSLKNLTRAELAGDKVTKATPWLEMAQAGGVYVVQGAWNRAFFDEVENFPYGAHDDQVDTVSVGAHALGLAGIKRFKAHSAQVKFYG